MLTRFVLTPSVLMHLSLKQNTLRSSRLNSVVSQPRKNVIMMAGQGPSTRITIPNRNGHRLATVVEEPPNSPTAPVVILCHGLLSSKDSTNFPALSAALNREGFACVRFDFSGNGESEGEFQFFNYTHEVEDIHAVVTFFRALGREVVMLVGHSKSGNNVLLYAAKNDGTVPLIVNLAGRFHMKDGITDRFGTDIFNRLDLERAISFNGRLMTYEHMQERLNTDMHISCRAINRSRVCTVHGTDDSVIPIRDAHLFDQVIRGHKLEVVPGADHNFRGAEYSERMIGAVISFLKANIL